ncbi:MAG: S49 family peptidase [Acidiphilium sp.]|nr:S49 family peptidase [Acidiphilium sp.]MDD4936982.1 S49 family peptidase [Acidiphilium sp.]
MIDLAALREKLPQKLPWKLPRKLPWSPMTVPVIRMSGVIAAREGAINLDRFAAPLIRGFDAAKSGENLLILAIESPGGSPVQSDLLGRFIRRKAAETGVRVVAIIGDVGASGGYWIACAADEILANPMSIVGSIGVIGGGFGVHQLIRRYGIERRIVTAGTNKLRNDPFSPEREEDAIFNRSLLDDIHNAFKSWVRTRRGAAIDGCEAEIFDGSYMLGEKAKSFGLIDGFGDVRSVIVERVGEKAKPAFMGPKKKFGLMRLLGRDAGVALINAIEAEAMSARLR